MIKSCCFRGHEKLSKEQLEIATVMLVGIAEKLIEKGYKKFTSSFSDGVDLICASIINRLKKKNKELFLEAALPYKERLKNQDKKFVENLEACNGIYVVKIEPKEDPQEKLNYCMVNASDTLVAVWDGHKTGVVFDAIEWAKILEKETIIVPVEPYLHLK